MADNGAVMIGAVLIGTVLYLRGFEPCAVKIGAVLSHACAVLVVAILCARF